MCVCVPVVNRCYFRLQSCFWYIYNYKYDPLVHCIVVAVVQFSSYSNCRQTVGQFLLLLTLQSPDTVPVIMDQLVQQHNIPPVQMMHLMTRLRLAKSFGSRKHRVQCVLVRLQAISVLGKLQVSTHLPHPYLITHFVFLLVYSMAPAEVVDPLIYDGLVEELVEVLEMKDPSVQVHTCRHSTHMYIHTFSIP